MTVEQFLKSTSGNHGSGPNYIMNCGDAAELAGEIRVLLSELDRLRADRQLENDLDLPPCTLTLKREVERWKRQAERLALGVKSEWDANEELRSRLDAQLGECERLKAILTSHGPEGHNVTNEQFVEMRDEVERLKGELAFYNNRCPVCNSILGLLHADACPLCAARARIDHLTTLAAQHLADQDYLIALERKRVAQDFAAAINSEDIWELVSYCYINDAADYKKRLLAVMAKYEVGE